MDHLTIATQSVIKQWELITLQATRLLSQLTNDNLSKQVAPGKNTGKYIIGHLIAINDAIPEILGITSAQHPNLKNSYVNQPDGVADDLLSLDELRFMWRETNDRVTVLIKGLPNMDWFSRHASITEEEFMVNPLRNRLSVLINRCNHFSYHVGQLRLLKD